jgi:hypothetical protein
VLVIALLAVAGTVISTSAATESPQQVLKRAEKFLQKAKSFEFKAAIGLAGAPPAGTLEEAAIFPDRGHALLTLPDRTAEGIFDKEVGFGRGAPTGQDISAAPYTPLYGHGEYAIFGRPQDLKKILGQIEDPQIVSTGAEGTVLRANFKEPGKVYNIGTHPYTAAHIDVTIAANGEPTAVALAASGPDGDVQATVDDINWNGRVSIPHGPKKPDFFDADAISQFESTTPLHQPKAIPRGWKLDIARVLPAEFTAEGCPQADIAYADPRSNQADYAEVFEFPTACARPFQGGLPLTLGPYQGQFAPGDPGAATPTPTQAQFDANGTTIQVVTSLSGADFEKVFGTLVAFNATKPPKASVSVGLSTAS